MLLQRYKKNFKIWIVKEKCCTKRNFLSDVSPRPDKILVQLKISGINRGFPLTVRVGAPAPAPPGRSPGPLDISLAG